MLIEPLSRRHDRAAFDCGITALNDFLQKTARQYAERDVGVTHVAVEDDGARQILGYVTLTIKTVGRDALPTKGLPKGEYGVAFIGQLATDKAHQGRGIGARLLYFTLFRAQKVSEDFGLIGVALDLLQEEDALKSQVRRDYYVKRGFEPLLDDENRLLMPMSTIKKMNLSASSDPKG